MSMESNYGCMEGLVGDRRKELSFEELAELHNEEAADSVEGRGGQGQ